MIWRTAFVAVLFAGILVACSDRERVNCPRIKNKAPSAQTTDTVNRFGGRC